MATHTKYTVLLAGLVLTVVCCLWKRQVAALPRLSVTFTGLWNNPRAEPKGFRIQPNGDRGLCAVFAVTNISKEPAIWFDTAFVEQKTEAGWIRVKPESWEAIDSSYMNSWWDSKMKQHASIGTWIVALAVSGCAGINSTQRSLPCTDRAKT